MVLPAPTCTHLICGVFSLLLQLACLEHHENGNGHSSAPFAGAQLTGLWSPMHCICYLKHFLQSDRL
jgi:hypothetical protein